MTKQHYLPMCCLVVLGGALLSSPPVLADDDPFQLDSNHWISFDHYKENVKAGRAPPPQPAAPPDESPPATAATGGAAATGAAASPPPAPTGMAAPTRAISTPPLPGLNKGYDIRVQSTADDAANSAPAAQIINMDSTPDLHFRSQNWQNASEAASHLAHTPDGGDDSAAHPLDIRMSYLPNPKITPVPSVTKKHNHGRPAATKKPPAPKEPPKSPADAAACAAVDAYKKKQLQAIESDRQTLEALQAAIARLGMQKQLDFMMEPQGSLSATTPNDAAAPPAQPAAK